MYTGSFRHPAEFSALSSVFRSQSAKQTGEQGNKYRSDQRNAAASHQLFHALAFC